MKKNALPRHPAATETATNAAQTAVTKQSPASEDQLPTYDPNHLLDTLMQHFGISSDGALARRLKIARDVLMRIRAGTIPVCASMLLWMQEATGIDVAELRRLMGDRRARFRLGISLRPKTAA